MIFGPAFKMIPSDCFGMLSACGKFEFDMKEFDLDKFDMGTTCTDQDLHGLDELLDSLDSGDYPLLNDEWLNAFADPNDVYAPFNDSEADDDQQPNVTSVKVENVQEEEGPVPENYNVVSAATRKDYAADTNAALRYNSHLDNITIKVENCEDSDSYYSVNSSSPCSPFSNENSLDSSFSDRSSNSSYPLSDIADEKALKHDHNYTNLTPQNSPKRRKQDTATPSTKKQCTTPSTTTITITLQQPRKVGRPRKIKPPENGSDIENNYFEPKNTNCRQARRVTLKGSTKDTAAHTHHHQTTSSSSSSKRGTSAKRDHKEMERQRRLQLKRKFESCYSAVPTHYFTDKKTGKQHTNPSKARILNSARQYMLTVIPFFHEIDSQVVSYERQVYASNKHFRTLMKKCQDLFA